MDSPKEASRLLLGRAMTGCTTKVPRPALLDEASSGWRMPTDGATRKVQHAHQLVLGRDGLVHTPVLR